MQSFCRKTTFAFCDKLILFSATDSWKTGLSCVKFRDICTKIILTNKRKWHDRVKKWHTVRQYEFITVFASFKRFFYLHSFFTTPLCLEFNMSHLRSISLFMCQFLYQLTTSKKLVLFASWYYPWIFSSIGGRITPNSQGQQQSLYFSNKQRFFPLTKGKICEGIDKKIVIEIWHCMASKYIF